LLWTQQPTVSLTRRQLPPSRFVPCQRCSSSSSLSSRVTRLLCSFLVMGLGLRRLRQCILRRWSWAPRLASLPRRAIPSSNPFDLYCCHGRSSCGNSALFTKFIYFRCFCFARLLRSYDGEDPLLDVRKFLHIQRRLLKLCRWWLYCRPHHSRADKAVGCESDASFAGNARCWNDKFRCTGKYILAVTGAGRAGAIGARRRYGGNHDVRRSEFRFPPLKPAG
jgi:hypothetical protein